MSTVAGDSSAQARKAADYRRQALVADIGGTNIRFALSDIDELTISNYALFKSELFSSPIEALEQYLRTTPDRPDCVGWAIAGPVSASGGRLTNLPWHITVEAIRKATGATHVSLINDFEAIALALPHLRREDLHQIGGKRVRAPATRAVLGPGTGLGVAALVHTARGYAAVAGEGGHVAFAPRTREEFDLVQALGADLDFVSAEQMLSGPGLVALYQLLCERDGAPVSALSAADVVQAAFSHNMPLAQKAMTLFVTWLGRFAGDAALTFGARGGVYLGGGIAPRILEALKSGPFRAAFEDKGRLAHYMEDIPVHVIATPNAGLKGAALAVAAQAAAQT